MRFIELHRNSDGQAMLVNLDDIALVRPARSADITDDAPRAVLEWRSSPDTMIIVSESYKDIRGALIRAGVITV